jgi:hypothetical protein
MLVGYGLSLTGLVLDISGAFVLSLDAIGLDRVHAWTERFVQLRSEIEEPNKPIGLRHPARFISAIGAGAGAGIGPLLHNYFMKDQSWVSIVLFSFLGGISAVMIGFGIIFIIRFVSILLTKIERKARERTVGGIGFVLLILGFLLQFVGTTLQAL